MPVRYFPVRTPRPSGDQASTPAPTCSAARQQLALGLPGQERVFDLGGDDRRPGRRPPAGRPPPRRVASPRSRRPRRRPPGRRTRWRPRRPGSPPAAPPGRRRAAATGPPSRRRAGSARRRSRRSGASWRRRAAGGPTGSPRPWWNAPAPSAAPSRASAGRSAARPRRRCRRPRCRPGCRPRSANMRSCAAASSALGVTPPRHRAEPQAGYRQSAPADIALLHDPARLPPGRVKAVIAAPADT